MSFKKTGDEAPILNIYDSNVKQKYCSECGKKLRLIAIADGENKLICDCQLEKTEELN